AIWFFFSSRRRHTRFSRDWSSDVCSSDLHAHDSSQKTIFGIVRNYHLCNTHIMANLRQFLFILFFLASSVGMALAQAADDSVLRSEERRVGTGDSAHVPYDAHKKR